MTTNSQRSLGRVRLMNLYNLLFSWVRTVVVWQLPEAHNDGDAGIRYRLLSRTELAEDPRVASGWHPPPDVVTSDDGRTDPVRTLYCGSLEVLSPSHRRW